MKSDCEALKAKEVLEAKERMQLEKAKLQLEKQTLLKTVRNKPESRGGSFLE